MLRADRPPGEGTLAVRFSGMADGEVREPKADARLSREVGHRWELAESNRLSSKAKGGSRA